MLYLISIFTGPFRTIITYGLIIVFIIGIGFGYLKIKENEAAKEALLQFNKAQLEQVVKENNEYSVKLKALQSQLDVISKTNSDLTEKLQENTDKTDQWINTQKDVNLDPIFNETLKHLKGK